MGITVLVEGGGTAIHDGIPFGQKGLFEVDEDMFRQPPDVTQLIQES